MNPGLDPLDPLELALLMEAAEDLGDLDRDDCLGATSSRFCVPMTAAAARPPAG